MEISKEKSKIIVNGIDIDHASILMDGTILEDVKTFKYIGSTIKYGCSSKNELRIPLETDTSAMIRLNTIWSKKYQIFKFNLYTSLIIFIFYYVGVKHAL